MSPASPQLGIRNVSSTAKDGYEAARAMGDDILSVRQMRKLGRDAVLARIPKGARLLRHHRHRRLRPLDRARHRHAQPWRVPVLRGAGDAAGLARAHDIVGIDLVEVAPDYDHSGTPRSWRRRSC
jgi:agmatinase